MSISFLKGIICLAIALFQSGTLLAESFRVDVRHRPPEMIIEADNVSGPVIDIIERILTQHGFLPQWQVVPWPRSLANAKLDQVDLLPRHSMNSRRDKFLSPLLLGFENREVNYLVSPLLNKSITKSADLNGLVVGLLRSSFYGSTVSNLNDQTPIIYTNSIDQLVELLVRGRIDVAPIQNIEWAEQAYQHMILDKYHEKYKVAEFKEHFISGKYLSIPKASNKIGWFNKLNCSLFELRKNKTIDQIYKKYGIEPYKQDFEHPQSIKQQNSCQ